MTDNRYHKLWVILLFTLFFCGAYAQSGAHFSFAGINRSYENRTDPKMQTGWDIRLAGRLGSKLWFFAPELAYRNVSMNPLGSNPFEEAPRLHILQAPIGLGLKIKTTPFQKLFVKGGLVGNYIMFIDDNDMHSFKNLKDVYSSYFGAIGYDLYWFTIAYRYEKVLGDTDRRIPGSDFAVHSLSAGINF